MKKPSMILFDYGHTLCYEPNWDSVRGNKALLPYITKNPYNKTLEDIVAGVSLIYGKHLESIRANGYDISGQVGDRVLYEYLGIEFSLTPLEQEIVFWRAASEGAIMPNADKMLDHLHLLGIRTGVISNLLWSGEALRERLDRLLPNNHFEFIMTSSDYIFRKPNPILFEIALRKAGLPASEVWYCGDNPEKDIEGASAVGIFPVHYDNDIEKSRDRIAEIKPKCEHLYIKEWDELIRILK